MRITIHIYRYLWVFFLISGKKCTEFDTTGTLIQENSKSCGNANVPCPVVYKSHEVYKCKHMLYSNYLCWHITTYKNIFWCMYVCLYDHIFALCVINKQAINESKPNVYYCWVRVKCMHKHGG